MESFSSIKPLYSAGISLFLIGLLPYFKDANVIHVREPKVEMKIMTPHPSVRDG